jgi:hypothetical protein
MSKRQATINNKEQPFLSKILQTIEDEKGKGEQGAPEEQLAVDEHAAGELRDLDEQQRVRGAEPL